MVSRDQKRLSLPFNLLSHKKGKPSPQRRLYISKPMGAIGPSGDSLRIYSDDTVVPLRVYCEIFGPSVHYKSVGVKLGTTVEEVISILIQKMDRVGADPDEYSMAEMSILPDFSYIRILDECTSPLLLHQQHSKRYGSSDSWRLKLVLKSQIGSLPSLFLADYKNTQDPNLTHITVDCNCLEDAFLTVTLPISSTISCEKVINKIISEFAYLRQPDDFSLHCFSHPVLQNDPIPIATSIELLQKICRQEIMELYLKYKYDDVVNDNTCTSHTVSSENNTQAMSTERAQKDDITDKSDEKSKSVEDSWVEFYDPVKDRIYYINSETEEIRWLHPTSNQETYLDTDLPPGWVRGVDKESSRIYYRNTFDKKIEWSHPLRHLQRIYKHSLQPIGNTSLPRPSIPQSDPPPVPKSSRPVLDAPLFSQEGPELLLCEKKSRSLHSSNQSFSEDIERSSSDALLTDSLTGVIVSPHRHKAYRKNKRLNNLKRFLANEKTSDISDNTSVGSGHKIKSIFAPLNRGKRVKDHDWVPEVIVNVTPEPSPVGRKKSIVSAVSSDSSATTPLYSNAKSQDTDLSFNDSTFADGELTALQSSLEREQDDTSRFSSMFSELAHHSTPLTASTLDQVLPDTSTKDQTAVTALDEAFSLLDQPSSENQVSTATQGRSSGLVIQNQNTRISSLETKRKEESQDLLNDCFDRISDSSFDEGSDEEMIEPTNQSDVIVPDDKNINVLEIGGDQQGGESVVEADDLIESFPSVSELKVSAKVALFEQKLLGVANREEEMNNTDYRDVYRDHNGNSNIQVSTSDISTRDRTESASTDSVSGESVRTEDSEGVAVSRRSRNKLRTKKGRMSRNTSALDHQELEQLNKGMEPQKSILKHSRSDAEDRENKKGKGVTFLTSSVRMIEIERMSNSDTSQGSELDSVSMIHGRGMANWRNALKNFYDEVDKQDLMQFTKNETKSGTDDLVWSPDEGIGLVEEERFIQEATELARDDKLAGVHHENTEEELMSSFKHSFQHSFPPSRLDTRPPLLPPRPTSDDIADLVDSNSDQSATPKHESGPLEEIAESRDESGDNLLTATHSMLQDVTGIMQDITSMVDDAASVVHKNKLAATEQQLDRCNRAFLSSCMSQNEAGDNSAIADSGMFSLETSTNLDDSPYKGITSPRAINDKLNSIQSDRPVSDEPVIVSSLVESITLNAMIPMDLFLPKERPYLDSVKEDIASPTLPDPVSSPVFLTTSTPSLLMHVLPKTRSPSPVLVDQLNKPLSETPFIHGYQYQRKPADKSATLHSGYLALVRQTMESGEQQAKQQGKKARHLYIENI